jgi:hypothetical protein
MVLRFFVPRLFVVDEIDIAHQHESRTFFSLQRLHFCVAYRAGSRNFFGFALDTHFPALL